MVGESLTNGDGRGSGGCGVYVRGCKMYKGLSSLSSSGVASTTGDGFGAVPTCNFGASTDGLLGIRAAERGGGRRGATPGNGNSHRPSSRSSSDWKCWPAEIDPLRTLTRVVDLGFDRTEGGDEMEELSLLLLRLPEVGEVNGGMED